MENREQVRRSNFNGIVLSIQLYEKVSILHTCVQAFHNRILALRGLVLGLYKTSSPHYFLQKSLYQAKGGVSGHVCVCWRYRCCSSFQFSVVWFLFCLSSPCVLCTQCCRVSGLSNFDCPFGFLKRLFSLKLLNFNVYVFYFILQIQFMEQYVPLWRKCCISFRNKICKCTSYDAN